MKDMTIFNTLFSPKDIDADLVRINFNLQRVEFYKDGKVTIYYPNGEKELNLDSSSKG